MHPILLTLGPVTLYTYGAMLVLAFSLSAWLAGRILRDLPPELQRLTPGQAVDLSCLALLGGIAGGRLFFVVLHWRFFLDAPQYLLALWQGGLVWYGGFAGGLTAAWLYARHHRVPFRWVLDLFAPILALGHAVGRVGCFLNGCCYGEVTDAWCGIIMPGEPRPVFPTQLAESLGLLFLYITLRLLQRPSMLVSRPGRLFGVYLCGYAVLRFILEGYRGDQVPVWAGLTLQQMISVLVLLTGLLLMTKGKRQ
jgi:phosphatidylglycerol:prolipoprotein diacylglycerol transferase